MKQTFWSIPFLSKFLLVEKKNENALKHVLISSNCTKHIKAGDIKVFCVYLKHAQILCSYAEDF